jgi:cytochrome oxidase assembly protein ShyY1
VRTRATIDKLIKTYRELLEKAASRPKLYFSWGKQYGDAQYYSAIAESKFLIKKSFFVERQVHTAKAGF